MYKLFYKLKLKLISFVKFKWLRNLKSETTVAFFALLFAVVTTGISTYFTNKQIVLAEKQFEYTIQDGRKKEIDDSVRYINDTTESNKQFKIINDFNKNQVALNSAQLIINKEQLSTFRIQADIAKSQYESQKIVAKETLYETRPIFSIKDLKFDSLKKTTIISYLNIGKRPAKIKSIKACYWNERLLIFRKTEFELKMDINTNNAPFINLSSYLSIFIDPETIYYLQIYYLDDTTLEEKTYVKYFSIDIKNNANAINNISLLGKTRLVEKAKTNEFICIPE